MTPNKYFIYIIFSFLLACIFFSCGKSKYVMPQDKMAEVLYDIELIQALSQTQPREYSSSDAKNALMQGVLAKHNITKEVLDSSLVWYSDNIELLKKVKDSISSRLNKEQTIYAKLLELENRRNGAAGDIPYYYYLTPENYIFRFNFDSTKVKTLKLTPQSDFSFKVLGLSRSIKANLCLYMQYSDTTVINSQFINADSSSISLGYLKDRKLKSFSGYIRVNTSTVPDYSILIYSLKFDNDSVKKKVEIVEQELNENLTQEATLKK